MISSVASITSSSSVTVRVEKATSEFLIGPDWTLNIDICDTVNSNQMLAKDVVKAVKKRLQHKNPKVQLLALTLLETMVKNCGDYVHFQIAERNILQEMVKIVRKKTDMRVRDKILILIGSWHDAFGGPGGRYPQYYMAYEDLRRSGIQFPKRSPDAVPIVTPPVTQSISRHPQPGYGMPSSSSTRLDEAMASEDNLSLSSMESMRNVLALLTDMLQAVDPNDRMAIKGEVIVDLVEQCRANQRKLMQSLATIGDEELLGQGLELNDSLQSVLAKHDAIASGSPLPPEVKSITNGVYEKHGPSLKSTKVSKPSTASNGTSSAPVFPVHRSVLEEEDEEEDDFAQLARRHLKTPNDVSGGTHVGKSGVTYSEAPSSPSVSNALVPIDMPASARTKDQDIIDLLSITLSTATTTEQASHAPPQSPSTGSGVTPSSEAYPGKLDMPFNNYIAPWALPQQQPQTQPQSQPQPTYKPTSASQPQHLSSSQPQQFQSQPQARPQPELQLQHQTQYQHPAQPALHPRPQIPQYPSSSYPAPPWAATPGYFSNQASVSRSLYTYPTSRPTFSLNPGPLRQESTHGETRVNSSPRSAAVNTGQKPFIPSYRLFEDLDVFGNTERKFKATSNASPNLLESSSRNMVGGRK